MMMLMIRDLPKEDLPRERLIKFGSESLSNEELLSIILRTGTKGQPVTDLAKKILHKTGSLKGLKDISLNSLNEVGGLGTVKSVTLKAAIELGRRVYASDSVKSKETIHNAFDAYRLFSKYIASEKQENFMAIYLDTHKRYIAHKVLFKGTLNSSIVHPREIYKEAVLNSASAVIVMHNHPSGIVTPSKNDDEVTLNLVESGVMLGIPLIDHLIVSEMEYFSYNEEGKMKYV